MTGSSWGRLTRAPRRSCRSSWSASSLGRQFETATAVGSLEVQPLDQAATDAIVKAAAGAAHAYAALAAAAGAGKRQQYELDARLVSSRELALRSALSRLTELGYSLRAAT